LPKPKGCTGSTKMKILAIIRLNEDRSHESYGYSIWQCLKDNFHIYLNDNDIRNVYHHLNDLCALNMLVKKEEHEGSRCLYELTKLGAKLYDRYEPYLTILKEKTGLG